MAAATGDDNTTANQDLLCAAENASMSGDVCPSSR
jgi:hypothetical protein